MRLPKMDHARVLYTLMLTPEMRQSERARDRKWTRCIDKVLRGAPSDEMRAFFEAFFCEKRSCDDIQYSFFIERSTLYSWRNYFLWNVALEAARCGLLPDAAGKADKAS